MAFGLSDREAGKLVGVSHVSINKAKKNGRIPTLSDGTITKEALLEWHHNRRKPRGGNKRKVNTRVNSLVNTSEDEVNTADPQLDDLEEQVNALKQGAMTGVFKDYQQAELHKESYTARLKELEYHRKCGEVVLVEDVSTLVGKEYARIRTRLLALPAEQSPSLFQCQSVNELQDKLHTLVTRILEELSQDAVWEKHLSERYQGTGHGSDAGQTSQSGATTQTHT